MLAVGAVFIVAVVFAAIASNDAARVSIAVISKDNSVAAISGKSGAVIEIYDPGFSIDIEEAPIPGSVEPVININTATQEELAAALPGIGPKKAAAIVEYRTLVGGFNSVWELIEVDGIGESTLRAIVVHCTIEDQESSPTSEQ